MDNKRYGMNCGVCMNFRKGRYKGECKKGHNYDFGFGVFKDTVFNPPCNDFIHIIAKHDEECRNYILKFGKYKGKTIEDVFYLDRDYCNWILNNCNNGKLTTALKKVMVKI